MERSPKTSSQLVHVVKDTTSQFLADDCMGNGAAIAYYTIFSLPPLLAIIFTITSHFWSEETVTRVMKAQLGLKIKKKTSDPSTGEEGLELTTIAQRARGEREEDQAQWAKWLGIGILIFSASGVLAKLQEALNKAWNVEPDPQKGGIKQFVLKRALS
ncbi:MAG: YihY/virulence factor BrkB family protein, partial [Planctomycetaceae bacterium]|nr:YihY/virulence factor BrkB family protein [Planctomycetaceae bacterium]